MVEHFYTWSYVGPNVVIQCCCGGFHVVKHRDVAQSAFQAAREHVLSYASGDKFAVKYAHVTFVDEALAAELRNKQKQMRRRRKPSEEDHNMVHGVSRHRGVGRKYR